MKKVLLVAALAVAAPLWAQQSLLDTEFQSEAKEFRADCSDTKKLFDCAELLFTGDPLHIAVGSLAPENGFGAGLAFVAHYTPNENWRLYWNADAVATPNQSWRAGAYMSAVLIRHPKIGVHEGTAGRKKPGPEYEEMPVFHLYGQGESLNKLSYYGLGENSGATPTYFGMTESIAGGNVIWPLGGALHAALLGEANGRFYSIHASDPNQPAFAQFGEGIRIRPNLANGHVRLNYSASFQEWAASRASESFRRFVGNFAHEFPLYQNMRSEAPRDLNGPDSCAADYNRMRCPTPSRNLEGSFGFLFLYTASYVPAGSSVPFFIDPTLGGSDISGTPLLPSLPDYRYRGPDLLLFRGSFEHSIYKWPVGVKFMVDEGRVALTPGDLGFTHLAHSYSAGLTLHAGGLPVLQFLFSWGGHEGTHTIASIGDTLLGGTSRPSAY